MLLNRMVAVTHTCGNQCAQFVFQLNRIVFMFVHGLAVFDSLANSF